MDVTTLLEPKVDLPRLSEILDDLGHEGRIHTVGTWSKAQFKAVYEAAKGFRPIDLDFVVPPSVGRLVEVIHDGRNTLPLFAKFQKRFARTDDSDRPVAGYNDHSMHAFTGPGYFSVTIGGGEHEGELVFDYTNVPRTKAPSWPAIRKNEWGIAGIVNGGMFDYVRGLSSHVSIGTAFKRGRHRNEWFAIVRRDPS